MVDNLLTFSRIGSTETQTQPLELGAEVELALSDLSAAIDETGATIRVEIEPVIVPADRAELGRLIQNIVSNAIKHRKPGAAPSIAIRTARLGRTKIRLSIPDDGLGFDQKPAPASDLRSARRSPTAAAGR